MKGMLTMSQKELDRLEIISQIETKTMTVEEGSDLMRISPRQNYRILEKIKEDVSKEIIHKLRNKKTQTLKFGFFYF